MYKYQALYGSSTRAGNKPGNIVYHDLNQWDRFRIRLGPGHGIVSGNDSRNAMVA